MCASDGQRRRTAYTGAREPQIGRCRSALHSRRGENGSNWRGIEEQWPEQIAVGDLQSAH